MNWRVFLSFLNSFVSLGDHLPNFRKLFIPIGMFHMGLHFILCGWLEGVGKYVGVFPVSKWIVVEGTAGVGIGLSLHNLASDIFEFPFESQLVFCFLLESLHHFIDCLVSLLFETLVFSLVFLQPLLFLLELCLESVILFAEFLELVCGLLEWLFLVDEDWLNVGYFGLPLGHEGVNLLGDFFLCLGNKVLVFLLLII